jgi:hypothetical protein
VDGACNNSLPISPVMKTVESLGATLEMLESTVCKAGVVPTISSNRRFSRLLHYGYSSSRKSRPGNIALTFSIPNCRSPYLGDRGSSTTIWHVRSDAMADRVEGRSINKRFSLENAFALWSVPFRTLAATNHKKSCQHRASRHFSLCTKNSKP